MYFLNYLAGDLVDDARKAPMFDDPAYAWIKQNWATDASQLPMQSSESNRLPTYPLADKLPIYPFAKSVTSTCD